MQQLINSNAIEEGVFQIFPAEHSKTCDTLTAHPLYGISEKECDAILWTALGKTSEEVALILQISCATVKWRMAVARRKLRVNNNNYLISRSFLLGVLRYETA